MFAALVCPPDSVKHGSPHTFSTIDQAALFNIVCLANTQEMQEAATVDDLGLCSIMSNCIRIVCVLYISYF